jgi:hypothetical protein
MQPIRTLLACALGLVLLSGTAAARTDTVSGAGVGPRALSLGEALRAAAVGSLAIELNPAGLAMSKTYVLEATYGYRGVDSANIVSVSACDSMTPRVAGCFFYNYVGASPGGGVGDLHMHEAGMTLAMPISDRIFLGWTTRYVDYHQDGASDDDRDNAIMGDGGLIIRLTDMLSVGVSAINLVGSDEAMFPRTVGTGLNLSPLPQLNIAADARWDTVDGSGRYGGGVEYFFTGGDGQQGYPLRIGYVYDDADGASYITGGLGLMSPKVAIDVGARRQVDGGDELLVQIGLRIFVPSR